MADVAEKAGEHGSVLAARALARAVDEVLGAFASGSVRNKVMDRALALGGYSSLPTDPAEFERFMGGPLPEAIEALLGATTSALVIEQLEPLVRRALVRPPPTVSGVLRTPARATTVTALKRPLSQAPEARPTLRVEQSSIRVVVVSADTEARLRLAVALGPGALVVPTLDVLREALEAFGNQRTVVVVDLRLSGAVPEQLETLRKRGPLVLWGGRADVAGALQCGARESPEQLAELTKRLLEES